MVEMQLQREQGTYCGPPLNGCLITTVHIKAMAIMQGEIMFLAYKNIQVKDQRGMKKTQVGNLLGSYKLLLIVVAVCIIHDQS